MNEREACFLRIFDDGSLLHRCNVDQVRLPLPNLPKFHHCFLDFHLAYFGYEGIDLIKAALRAGLSVSTEEMPIKVTSCPLARSQHSFYLLFQINLIATPLYKITTTTTDQTQGFAALQRALDLVKKTILMYDGTFRIKTESHVVVEQEKDQVRLLRL